MIEVKGIYNKASCFCSHLDLSAEEQIREVCNREEFALSKIRIMPDVHAGMGCTIGTTMTVSDKIVPGMVGVDIGCGMEAVYLEEKEIDLDKLDNLIRRDVPSGFSIRKSPHPSHEEIDLNALRCVNFVNVERARNSIGTLGGGNHFIEIDRDEEGNLFLVIHSGSRHIGNEVAKHYQNQAVKAMKGQADFQVEDVIEKLKAEGRDREISETIRAMKAEHALPIDIPRDLAYLEGQLFEDYIHDMKIIQRFAVLNRKAMTEVILSGLRLHESDRFTTIHNYVDTDEMILRKGAVSAKKDERLLIPINMRDGSLICVGKGNEDWNCSAPHGAGRLMSRTEAFSKLTLEEFREQMEGIYSTCVTSRTLDESPMAYKNMDDIIDQIHPTVDVLKRIVPIYNFKA
jgi:RNA-splicing ligase RtcB